MKPTGWVLLLSWFWTLSVTAQDTLTLIPENFQPQWMLLRYLKGAKTYYLTSADSVRRGRPVHFILQGQPAGEYAVQYDVNHARGFRFIYNHENVRIAFDPRHKYAARVERSRENRVYFAFLHKWDSLRRQINRLRSAYIRQADPALQARYRALRNQYEALFDRYRQSDSTLMAWHFIRARYKRLPDSLLPTKEADARFAQAHYFDGIDMNDTVLYRSNLLTDRILTYVLKIPVPAFGRERTQTYLNRIRQVFDRLHYPPMRAEMLEGLMQVFNRQDRIVTDTLLAYYHRMPAAYQNHAFEESLKRAPVPVKGEKLPVAQISALGKWHLNPAKKYHLFVFYASDCPHCRRALPAVYKRLLHAKNIDVTAIGLESDALHWQNFIKPLKGWQHLMASGTAYGGIIADYGIEYTPTWFLTDNKLQILEKVTGESDIQKLLDYYRLGASVPVKKQ